MIHIFFRKTKNVLRRLFVNPLVKSLFELPNAGQITIFDVGAAGDIEPRWRPFAKHLHYVGFEPDERSRKELLLKKSKENCKTYTIIPKAVWNATTELTLHFCSKPQVSSVYEPNFEFLRNFPDVERFDIVSKERVSVVPMDSLQLKDPDFMKFDIQGGELRALEGAQSLLKNAVGLELEVEFVSLYVDQPLFGDICELLSQNGFEFVDFVNLVRWHRQGPTGTGQCVWGDALFLRTPEKIDFSNISIDKLSAYFGIIVIYRRFDLIDKTMLLLPKDVRERFRQFHASVSKAKRADRIAKRIADTSSGMVSFLGSNYRTHLIY